MRIRMQFLIPLLLTVLLSEARGQWVQTNGPFGAPVLSFASSGANLFAGTDQGVARSTDNGVTWNFVALPPSIGNANALLNVNGSLFVGVRGGIYVSTDTGKTWTSTFHWTSPVEVTALFNHGSFLFAGTAVNGVFRSSDNGATWAQINTGLQSKDVGAFASAGSYVFVSALGTAGGVYRSTNDGTSWTRVVAGLTHFDVRALTISGSKLFAGADGGAVFRSTDYGTSWTEADIGTAEDNVTAFAFGGAAIYAATYGAGVFRSTDDGATWAARSSFLNDPFVNTLLMSGTSLFAGTVDGVFCSLDNALSWSEKNIGLSYRTVYALSLNDSGTTMFAGTSAGVFRSTDNGTSWMSPNVGLKLYDGNTTEVYALALIGKSIFAGTNGDHAVYRSTDNGTSWSPTGPGLPLQNVASFGVNGQILFAGMYGGGVYSSTDNGFSWQLRSAGIPTNVTVNAFAVNNQVILAATGGAGVYRSTNNGLAWTASNSGLPNPTWGSSFTLIPADSGRKNLVLGTQDNGIYFSSDNGLSWNGINAGPLLYYTISAVAASGGNLLAATAGHGMYVSSNLGKSWTQWDQGLTDTVMNALALSTNGTLGSTLFAGTKTGGVFRYAGNNFTLASIAPSTQTQATVGKPFWVELRVGTPQAVSDLYGVSLKLKSNKASCIYVNGTGATGEFLGTSVLSLFHKNDPQTAEIGVTKTISPGAQGAGVVARAIYTSSASGSVQFSLEDVVALDSHGTVVPLDVTQSTVLIAPPTVGVKTVPKPPYAPGSKFWVEVRIGDPDIQGLHRISFKLSSDRSTCAYVTGSAASEGFLGLLPTVAVTPGDLQSVSMEITKGTPGGANGSGYVAKAQFVCPSSGDVHFTLSNVAATDMNGNTIPVIVTGSAITVTTSTRVPVVSAKIPATSSTAWLNEPTFFSVSVTDPNGLPLTYIWNVGGDTKQVGDSTFLWTFTQPSGMNVQEGVRANPSVVCIIQDQAGLADSTVWSPTITSARKDVSVPMHVALSQNYPNPFNPSTSIQFELSTPSFVALRVFDVLGREIAMPVNEIRNAGRYLEHWNAAGFPSGIYFYQLQVRSTGGNAPDPVVETKRMVLVK